MGNGLNMTQFNSVFQHKFLVVGASGTSPNGQPASTKNNNACRPTLVWHIA
jgi:hypothetical protein